MNCISKHSNTILKIGDENFNVTKFTHFIDFEGDKNSNLT